MTKADIVAKTLRDMHSSADPASPEYEENIFACVQKRVPEGDSKTCEDFEYLKVECCETCHTFMAHDDMYPVDLPEGGKAWICCAVRSELFPETRVDESNPEQKLIDWILAGNKLGDYCGYVPPDLLEKIFDAGLLDSEVSGEGNVPVVDQGL